MMQRRVVFALSAPHVFLPSTAASTVARRGVILNYLNNDTNPHYDTGRSLSATARDHDDTLDAGYVDKAPRANGADFEFVSPAQEVPGAHPLPLTNGNVAALRWPLVSPYMPSPHRAHPYFTEPVPEFPHFEPTVPTVYTQGVIKEPIIVPVFSTETGAISHTRRLDPYVFGQYPLSAEIADNAFYWVVRNQNYRAQWELARDEIFRKAKKNWPNTGTGMPRVSNRRNSKYPWGGRYRPNKPWNYIIPTADPTRWHTQCRMTLALKVLQGKVQVVDRLSLREPTAAAFNEMCDRMKWDTRHTGAGVLFIDGGSRITPSVNFDRSFFYGSFVNGRVKVVRPTIRVDDPFDWNPKGEFRESYFGPRGQKNPVPFNRFNTYDALEHHLLVMTEGAVVQLEQEMEAIKTMQLPPHIRNYMAEAGMLDHHLLGTRKAPLEAVEYEAAGRVEEREKSAYEGYYDNPYKPWADEEHASYEVDEVHGLIRRNVDGRPASWNKIQ